VNFDNEEGAAPEGAAVARNVASSSLRRGPADGVVHDRLARAMDVGLLTERQARTAGERVWLRMDEPSR
jgi:hypothetical protein